MKTQLVNLRTYQGKDYIKIGRTTIFGNPFPITETRSRTESIELFGIYLRWRLKTDPAFRRQVRKLAGHRLACWCTPLPCHGDIYIEYLEGK